jgi:hypothetical protein
MGVKLVASSGGSVELVPTNTASNFTVTVPAATGTVLLNNSNDQTINGLTVGRGAGAVSTNTAVGASGALGVNTTGANDVAVGAYALQANTTGSQNTGIGQGALYANTTGSDNTAIGFQPLAGNTTGGQNVAIGRNALASNTTAANNTAVGYQAGYSTTTGTESVYIGQNAGYSATTNGQNVFVGRYAGYPTTGNYNAFFGYGAGSAVTSGTKNTIIGRYDGNYGGLDIRTASNYIVLSDGDGNPRCYFDNNGSPFLPRAYVDTTASAANVNVDAAGQLRRSTSALKYKQDVRNLEEMDISLLRPVRYKSKCEGDDQTKDHLGLIADEAAEAGFEELVSRGSDGEIEGFQYERLTVVLLKKLQVLEAEIAALKGQA